jgi:cobalamin 5'-phosphate synthase/cobalamin synthase
MSRLSRFVTDWLHPAVAAFQLLTRFPVKVNVAYEGKLFQRSVVYYPLAGLAVGLLLGLIGWLGVKVLPAAPAALLLTAVWVYVTGGLHMDGLMDTADGLFSWRSRERMLEIMKDSRVGAMGVLACVLQLAAKWSLCVVLVEQGGPLIGAALVGAAVWARAWMAGAIAWWPYARAEAGAGGGSGTGKGGMGSPYGGVRTRHVAAALAVAFVLQLLVGSAIGLPLPQALLGTLAFGAVTVIVGTLLARRIVAKLGGLTGDTYGAQCELLETTLLLLTVAALHTGLADKFVG